MGDKPIYLSLILLNEFFDAVFDSLSNHMTLETYAIGMNHLNYFLRPFSANKISIFVQRQLYYYYYATLKYFFYKNI